MNTLLDRQVSLWNILRAIPQDIIDAALDVFVSDTDVMWYAGANADEPSLFCPAEIERKAGGSSRTIGGYGNYLAENGNPKDSWIEPVGSPIHTSLVAEGYTSPTSPTRIVSGRVVAFYYLASTSFRTNAEVAHKIRAMFAEKLGIEPIRREVGAAAAAATSPVIENPPVAIPVGTPVSEVAAPAPVPEVVVAPVPEVVPEGTTAPEAKTISVLVHRDPTVDALFDAPAPIPDPPPPGSQTPLSIRIERARTNYGALRWLGFSDDEAKQLVRRDFRDVLR